MRVTSLPPQLARPLEKRVPAVRPVAQWAEGSAGRRFGRDHLGGAGGRRAERRRRSSRTVSEAEAALGGNGGLRLRTGRALKEGGKWAAEAAEAAVIVAGPDVQAGVLRSGQGAEGALRGGGAPRGWGHGGAGGGLVGWVPAALRPPGLSQPSAPRPRAGAPLGSSRGSLLSQLWDSVHPRVAACPSPCPAAGFEALGVREWGFC